VYSGVFRLSGGTAAVAKVRRCFGESPNKGTNRNHSSFAIKLKSRFVSLGEQALSELTTTHDVCAVLKQWLRDLPHPLIIDKYYDQLITAMNEPSPLNAAIQIRNVLITME